MEFRRFMSEKPRKCYLRHAPKLTETLTWQIFGISRAISLKMPEAQKIHPELRESFSWEFIFAINSVTEGV